MTKNRKYFTMNSFEDVEQTKSRRVKLGQKVASLHQSKILHFTLTVKYFLLSKNNSKNAPQRGFEVTEHTAAPGKRFTQSVFKELKYIV